VNITRQVTNQPPIKIRLLRTQRETIQVALAELVDNDILLVFGIMLYIANMLALR